MTNSICSVEILRKLLRGIIMTLGNRVKQRRKLLGYTQHVLAEQVGLTQQAINRIESDIISRPRFILELAQVLECDPEWLLKGSSVSTKA